MVGFILVYFMGGLIVSRCVLDDDADGYDFAGISIIWPLFVIKWIGLALIALGAGIIWCFKHLHAWWVIPKGLLKSVKKGGKILVGRT